MINLILALAVLYLGDCFLVDYLGRKTQWGYRGYLLGSFIDKPVAGLLFLRLKDPERDRRPMDRGREQ